VIIDTSAIVAILKDEPEGNVFTDLLLASSPASISAACYVEAAVVIDGMGDPVTSGRLDQLLAVLGVTIVDLNVDQARFARAAYRDFGRGSGHPARLNLGDCFSYALAKATGEPLLFTGDDFGHTDLTPAVPA
jgi:ribonuclease VapC